MKYATFDNDGFPIGFYDESIHGERLVGGGPNPNTLIPLDAVGITDDQWEELLEFQGMRRWVDGEIVEYEPEPQFVELPKAPKVVATAKLTVSGGVLEGFTVDSRIAGGFQLDTGLFMLVLSEPISSQYIVSAFDGGLYRLYVRPEDYAEDYFIVTCTNLLGNMADPDNMSAVIITTE